MTMLQTKIYDELSVLPLITQKEVLDFILFLKEKIQSQSDTDFLSLNSQNKQDLMDGLKIPLNECSKKIEW